MMRKGYEFWKRLVEVGQDRARKEGQDLEKILIMRVEGKGRPYGLYFRPGCDQKSEFVTWSFDQVSGGTVMGNYFTFRPIVDTPETICWAFRDAAADLWERAGAGAEGEPTRAGKSINHLVSEELRAQALKTEPRPEPEEGFGSCWS